MLFMALTNFLLVYIFIVISKWTQSKKKKLNKKKDILVWHEWYACYVYKLIKESWKIYVLSYLIHKASRITTQINLKNFLCCILLLFIRHVRLPEFTYFLYRYIRLTITCGIYIRFKRFSGSLVVCNLKTRLSYQNVGII